MSSNLPDAIIAELQKHPGFDAWWGPLDEATSEQVMRGLATLTERPWQDTETAPPLRSGYYEVTVDTDDGPEVFVLHWNAPRAYWDHEGEPTYQHGYYFCPKLWRERAEPGEFPTEEDA